MLYYVVRIPVLLSLLTLVGFFVITALASTDEELSEESGAFLEQTIASTTEDVQIATIVTSSDALTATTTASTTFTPNFTETVSQQSDNERDTGILLDFSSIEEGWFPVSPADCFTEEATFQFEHPGICLRFFRQNF